MIRILCVLCLLPALSRASEVQVAVAANFSGPFERIAADFAAETGHRAVMSVGSTGKLYAQIRHGAPFDVLLAADDETPRRLLGEALGVAGSAFTYARGKLVVWSARAGLVDAQGAVLQRRDVGRIAICDARLAPYGLAAEEALRALGLHEATRPRWVVAESIGQAFQFAATGNADIGFVALSQVAVPGRPQTGSYWVVPAALYAPILQDAVLLKRAEQNLAARALMLYLKSDRARAVIRAYGYEL